MKFEENHSWQVYLDRYPRGYAFVFYEDLDNPMWDNHYYSTAGEILTKARDIILLLWHDNPMYEFDVWVTNDPQDEHEVGVKVENIFDDNEVLLAFMSI